MNMKAAGFVLAGGAVLVGLFLWLRPVPRTPDPSAAAEPAAEVHRFAVADGERIDGSDVIRARAGDLVTLRVSSDTADELHVHGYDLTADLRPDEVASLSFDATRTGRFEIELHGAHRTLTTLEVRPR